MTTHIDMFGAPFMKAKQRGPDRQVRADILIVEDEQDIRELVQHNLEREGFGVRCVGSGEKALTEARANLPDLILLDLMLPGIDGLEVSRLLKSDRQTARAAIVMLTAKGEEADVVVGLELGADDYIVKPFSQRVLVARIKAILRRREDKPAEEDDPQVVRLGNLVVDPIRHEVLVNGKRVEVTHTEFGMIHMLGRRPGRVWTRTQIIQEIQDGPAAVTDRSVDVHVTALRRKLGEAGKYLKTVRGVGYRLEDD